jgi:hypothetical protein
VRKYGHEGLLWRLLRWESKEAVAAKFDALIGELHLLTEEVGVMLASRCAVRVACSVQQASLCVTPVVTSHHRCGI